MGGLQGNELVTRSVAQVGPGTAPLAQAVASANAASLVSLILSQLLRLSIINAQKQEVGVIGFGTRHMA